MGKEAGGCRRSGQITFQNINSVSILVSLHYGGMKVRRKSGIESKIR